jgi:8-oxo-dGTP pyrophosphatase MutT (NUDIX family)
MNKEPDMANVLILNEDKHVLLIHNCKNMADRWEFPGGKIDEEDKGDLRRTAIRELEEECEVGVELISVFGDYATQTPEGEFNCRTYIGRIVKGKLRIGEKKKADVLRYFSYSELQALNKKGNLVPNLVSMLSDLKELVR